MTHEEEEELCARLRPYLEALGAQEMLDSRYRDSLSARDYLACNAVSPVVAFEVLVDYAIDMPTKESRSMRIDARSKLPDTWIPVDEWRLGRV